MGYLIFKLFFQTKEPIVDTQTPAQIQPGKLPSAQTGTGQIIDTSDPTQLPTTEKEKIIDTVAQGSLTETSRLNNVSSKGVVLSSAGDSLQFYSEEDGKFYKIYDDGRTSELTDKVFYNVENVTWSPTKNKAILEYPDGANIIYDFDEKKQITLPSHYKDFDFSSSGDKIVMKSMGLDPENRWLLTSNNDGSRVQPIESLGTKDETVYPTWSPNNQVVALYTESVDFDRQEVFFVGLNGENFKSTIINGRGFEYEWAPTGDRLVYSVYSSNSDLKPQLWIVNSQGDSIGTNRQPLELETFAHKCTFANDSDLYCAVPIDLPEGAGWMPEIANDIPDRLYKINTKTGQKTLVAIPNDDFNISQIIVSEDEDILFFTDNKTNNIHKVRLK